MRVQQFGHRIQGFYRLADYALRWEMIAPNAQRRLEILGFWRRHAFGGPGKPKPVRQPRLRKHKHFRAERPGHCVALVSIELRAQNEQRYIITCTDLHSHFACAWATRSHASAAAAQFFRLIQAVFPFAIEAVLTDSGREFQRHFAAVLADHLFTHWHTYPRTPKMNAHCERFNRTVQDECID